MLNSSKKFFVFFIVFLVLLILTSATVLLSIYLLSESTPKGTGKTAIVTNGIECAAIGREIFEKGGNVADAAVSVVLCEGITCPQSSGIGGGFFLTFYSKKDGKVRTLNARERAPAAATVDMFKDNPKESVKGGKSVAVPGEIKGLWELHKNYGKLPWKVLLEPVIKLCRYGHIVSPYLENIFSSSEKDIYQEESLREIYINPLTNTTYRLGERIKRLKLAETLEVIAAKGIDAMYGGGEIGTKMVEDVRKRNGILTVEDLKNYEVEWSTSMSTKIIGNNTLHTFPLPSSGACLIFIFNLLRTFNMQHNALSCHRIAESFKFAYAKRTHLGDDGSPEVAKMISDLTSPEYADEIRKMISDSHTAEDIKYYGPLYADVENHGTAHVSILAPNGDAISITNSINYKLGAFFRSEATGIILNNHMNDFSTPGAPNIYGIPPSPANFIAPGKIPLSSMIPSVVVDENGDVRMIIGAAGGSRIPTGVFAAIFNHLYLNKSLPDALNARRLHHQLTPEVLQYETNYDSDIMTELAEKFGHELQENKPDGGFAAVTGIAIENGQVQAAFDNRRGGSVEVF